MYELGAQKYGVGDVEAVCHGAVEQALQEHAVAIVAVTRGNELPRWISKYHAAQPIFVLTDNAVVANQVDGYYRACRTVKVSEAVKREEVAKKITEAGFVLDSGKLVVVDDWEKSVDVYVIEAYLVCDKHFFWMQLVTGFGSVFPLYRQEGAPEASFNYMLLSVVITGVL